MVGSGVEELQVGDEVFVNRRGYQSLTMEDGRLLATCREADVYAKMAQA
jgi:NADPH:quinone reductase-like Zn-dependent oxidoreductase